MVLKAAPRAAAYLQPPGFARDPDGIQDVDAAQLDLVATLAESERNLSVVGDDDQP